MISSQDLLAHADELLSSGRRGAPPQINLRRAISAAYYAVFHQLLTDATDNLIGKTKRTEAAYSLVYRSFEHRKMRERARKSINLPSKTAQTLGIKAFDDLIRKGAAIFAELQAERHRADYDPSYRPRLDTALAQVEAARKAIAHFGSAPKGDYQLFLVMLLFEARD